MAKAPSEQPGRDAFLAVAGVESTDGVFRQPADAAWWLISTMEAIERDKRNAEAEQKRQVARVKRQAEKAANASQLRSRASKLLQKVRKGINENAGTEPAG